MGNNLTSGYDILVQLSELELNNQLDALASQFPTNATMLGSPITAGDLELDSLRLDADSPAVLHGVTLIVKFEHLKTSASTYTFHGQIKFTGELYVDASIAGQRTIQIKYDDAQHPPTVHATVIADANNALAQAAALAAQALLPGQVKSYLINTLKVYSLGTIPLGPASNPLAPTDVQVTVIDDTSQWDKDCVTFMINTGGSTGGNPAGITQYLSSVPTGAIIVVSNQLLLEKIIRPQLASSLGATFNPPCVLASSVHLATYNHSGHIWFVHYSVSIKVYLNSLNVYVDGDHLRAVGTIGGSGTGFNISGNFDVRFYLVVQNGQIVVQQHVDVLHAHITLDWWVYVISGLTAGSIGLIMTALLQYSLNATINAMLHTVSVLPFNIPSVQLPSLPLGPAGGTLDITSVVLDDLIIGGTVRRPLGGPPSVSMSGVFAVSAIDHGAPPPQPVGSQQARLASAPPPSAMLAGSVFTTQLTRRAFRGLFAAHLSQPVYPLSYTWSLLATGNISGQGHFTLPGGNVYYNVDGPLCTIWTDMGVTMHEELRVFVGDGAGRFGGAIKSLSAVGIIQPFDPSAPLGPVLSPVGVVVPVVDPGPGSSSNPVIGSLQGVQATGPMLDPGIVKSVGLRIDRTSELAAAFAAGLSATKKSAP